MDGPIIQRLYYSPQEVHQMTGVKPPELRGWEMKFSRLRPHKNRAGRRLYRPGDLDIVRMIKRLKEAGFTDEKVETLLHSGHLSHSVIEDPKTFGNLRKDALLTMMYSDLRDILDILDSMV